MCIIQLGVNTSNLDDLDIMMNFINNKAGLAGSSIYATLIYNCTQYYSTHIDIRVLLNATFEPIPTDNGLQHISSVPVEICYCSKSNVTFASLTNLCQTLQAEWFKQVRFILSLCKYSTNNVCFVTGTRKKSGYTCSVIYYCFIDSSGICYNGD